MFIAKFTQAEGSMFKADKNGNFPFIGNVVAGKAQGTLINGTMFHRDDMETNVLYLCENSVDPEYPTNQRVNVIAKVSTVEFLSLRKELGAPSVTIGATVSQEPEII